MTIFKNECRLRMEESKMRILKNITDRLVLFMGLFIGVALLSASCSGFLDVPGDPNTSLINISDSLGDEGSFILHEGETIKVAYKLNKRPTAAVTFTVTLNDASGEAVMTTTTLTFTPENWHKKQYIEISLPKDDITDENQYGSITFSPAVSNDPAYSGYVRPSQPIVFIDIDSDGVVVTPTQLETSEADTSPKTFKVVLTSKPAANVTINVRSNDTTEGTIDKSSLTFSNTNWKIPQIVTVTPQDDNLLDGDVSYEIVLSNTISTDPDYNGLVVSNVQVTNKDNEVPAIVVTPLVLEMDEGQTKTFTVTLNGAKPLSDVVIALTNPHPTRAKLQNSSNADITELTFTPADFGIGTSVSKTVKVVAIDNDVAYDDDVTGMVKLTLISNNYGHINPDDVRITIRDDDTPGYVISNMDKHLTEAGGTGQFTIKLKSKPKYNVVLSFVEDTLRNENCNEGKIISIGGKDVSGKSCSTASNITKTVTFTPSNWNTAQTVVLQGVDDDVDDGDIQYTLKILPDTTTQALLYQNLDPDDVSVNNTNNDTAGFIVQANNKVDGSTTTYAIGDKSILPIDGFATDDMGRLDPAIYSQFKIKLRSQPTVATTLTLTINSDKDDGVFVSNNSTSLTLPAFATTKGGANGWNVFRNVQIKGKSNGANEGNRDYTVSVAVSFGSNATPDPNYNNPAQTFRPTFRVYSCDNDVANLIVGCRRSGMFATTEGGGTAKIWFITQKQPTGDITLPVHSDQEDPANLPSNVTTAEGRVISGGGGAATGSPVASANAIITASNWNTMTTTSTNYVKAQGIDDAKFDANVLYNLVAGTSSGGLSFKPPKVPIRNIDDEQAFKIVVGNTSENEDAGTFQIQLGTNPTYDVKVNIACSNTDECKSVSPTALTFTPANWNINQTITVVGKNDNQADGPQNILVKFTKLATQDERLKDIQSPPKIAAINADNDRLIWVTTKTYHGNIGASSASDVDAKCRKLASDGNRPTGSVSSTTPGWFSDATYKALVAYNSSGGTTRRATTNGITKAGQSDWVLQPNTDYYLKTGSYPYATKLFTTDANGLIPFNMSHAFGGSDHWTGLNTNMTTNANTCSDGDGNSWKGDTNGAFGRGSAKNNSALKTGEAACKVLGANPKKSFICVQQ